MRAALLGAVFALAAFAAQGAETGGCGKFAWPIEADKALLAEPGRVESGATIAVDKPVGVRVELVEPDKAGFAVPPLKPYAPTAPGGVLRFEAKAGLWQVTTTDRVWIDMVQNGESLAEKGFSGVLDCDGARKSIRFKLADGPAVLQFSGSPARTVAVSVRRVEED